MKKLVLFLVIPFLLACTAGSIQVLDKGFPEKDILTEMANEVLNNGHTRVVHNEGVEYYTLKLCIALTFNKEPGKYVIAKILLTVASTKDGKEFRVLFSEERNDGSNAIFILDEGMDYSIDAVEYTKDGVITEVTKEGVHRILSEVVLPNFRTFIANGWYCSGETKKGATDI